VANLPASSPLPSYIGDDQQNKKRKHTQQLILLLIFFLSRFVLGLPFFRSLSFLFSLPLGPFDCCYLRRLEVQWQLASMGEEE
jgi:hypothetical protein